MKAYRSLFNYTSTYRLDSDFPMVYGKVKIRKQKEVRNYDEILKKKKKLMAWFVSNCNTESRRSTFMKKLQTYIPVDVYGACGPLKCARSNRQSCEDMLNTTYKFYFAAENTFCKDYVTEKFFRTFRLDVVPVVRGGGNYTAHGVPKDTYIDVLDYKTVKELADHLMHLDKHPQEYIKFIKAKASIDVSTGSIETNIDWCRFCEMLNDKRRPRKLVIDIRKWWTQRGCFEPPDITKL